MAIDYWALAKDFSVGSVVQKFMPGDSELTPYVGRVTAVMPGIGCLDVQWPFGNERVSAEEVVQVNPQFMQYLPPTLNTSYYPGLDTIPTVKTASGEKVWRTIELPDGFHRSLAALYHKQASALKAYDVLWHQYRQADDEALRDEVHKFYLAASNLGSMLVRTKLAAYWAARDRKYRATRGELDSRNVVNCPKCKEPTMKRATYKMEGGKRARLFACGNCMFLMKQSDVLGPGGEAVEW